MYLSHSQKRERTQKFSIESIIKHYSLNVVSHCIAFLKGNSDKCEICTQVLKPDKAAAHRPMASQAVPHPRVPSHHHIHTARLSVGQRESTASLSGCVQLPWGPTSYSMIPILVRQGIEGPLSRKLPTWTSVHSHEALFLFSSLGEQSSLPASSIRTYRTSQKRNMGLKNEKNKKRKRERERKPSFLLIQVRRLGLGFSHSPSQNEDRTSAAAAARGAEDTARYRS